MDKKLLSWSSIVAADAFFQISTTGKKIKTKECLPQGKYPVVDQSQDYITGYIDDSSKLIEINEPVVVFGDHTRVVKWVEFNFVAGADGVKVLKSLPYLVPRFSYYQLQALDIPNKGYSRHFKFLKELEFFIPPLLEQKNIAQKLDTLLSQVNSIKSHLDKIPQVLKQFRQSVLSAAVSGKLTNNYDQNIWSKKKLNELCISVSDGDHQAPPRSQIGIPFLVISDISNGSINFKNINRWVPEDYYLSLKAIRKPQQNDILYTVTGSFGIPVIVEKNKQFCFQRHIAIIKPNHEIINYRFLYYFLASPIVFSQAEKLATGTAQKTVSLSSLRTFEISVPSLEEQTEIVRRVEKLFAWADSIEKQVIQAQQRVNNLTQSILAKAFRGALTEQWRKDNPDLISGENSAESLLKKIKAERELAVPEKRGRKKS
ncbi:restriction endonuclease subunit S [Xenorhabdus sp. Sc-CR9]|uniref:restriction endonuclease subunit S n=1 Tax=Xenorhabdus sp. Sc-CR9 TaxID=2584468 RepID=UPI001F00F4B1|nr:restriction endonuclease subunit S [Xenorhabdus sp. Sc-CR9]